jgi:uncharacterized protein
MNEEIDALERGYQAFSRGDLEAAFDAIDAEIEWRPGETAPEGGEVHRGAAGFRRFINSWIESFEGFHLEPELFIAKGGKVISILRQRGRGRGSGVEVDVRVVHVWTVRDGRAVGWWGARSREEALEEIDDANLLAPLRGYEAFNRGDIPGALADIDPEIEWHTYIVPGPGGGTYRGHEGVRELWNDARNVFGEFRNEPERLIGAGDKVVAFVRVCGRGRESGVEVKAKIAHVHTLRDGKVVRVESFEDREEALRAVGLTE